MSTAARIDELLSKFDENPRRYFAPLANEYRKAGELTQAIALCREHLPKQPGHMSGHIVFGQALYEHGDLTEAQTVFEAALALDPENLIALRHLGDIARARGDASAARRWYGRVLDADPRNDDIAALLESLAQRSTPAFVAPVASEVAVEAPAPEEPDVFLDEPAWHTPTIPDGTPVVAEHQAAEPDAAARGGATVEASEVELLDLDAPVESAESEPADVEPVEVPAFLAEFEPTVAAHGHEAEHTEVQPQDGLEVFEAVERIDVGGAVDSVDALDVVGIAEPADDLDSYEWDTDERDAFGAESAHEVEEALSLEEPAAASEGAVAGRDDEPAEGAVDAAVAPIDETELGQRSLSDAIGAFASHDPLESIGELALPDALDHGLPLESIDEPVEAAAEAAFSSSDEFEEGLIALEWPDASQLAVRPPTPPRPLTPVASWAPVAASDDEPVEAPVEAPVAEASSEAEAWPPAPIESEALVEDIAAIEATEAVPEIETIEAAQAGLEIETVDAAEAVPEIETIDAAVPHEDVAAREADDVAFGREPAPTVDWAEPVSASGSGETAEDAPDLDPVGWVAEAEAFDDAEHDEDPLDEDPPLSTAEIPWLAEEEAHEIDAFDDADAPDAPHSPAFVTETMAELLVAQGFVSRAVGVYEELVARRPYDAVLASRLDELRGMLSETDSQTSPAAASTPVTPIAPLAAFTPIRGATPVAVPLVAPAPRRTAREWLASVAAMRVQRRTPAFGLATVAVPTPADGLSSLFSAAPTDADDVAARSLASAFGASAPVDHAAALFDAVSREPHDEPVAPPVARAATPAAGGALYSFDRFFPDPATAVPSSPATESDPASSRVVPPTGSPSDAGADLAQFASWLKGLSNS